MSMVYRVRGRSKLLKKLIFTIQEKPLIAQLWGLKPENFYKSAEEIAKMGFNGVDLNFGCPEKAVVKNGACAALINNRELAVDIIQATQAAIAGHIPVSIKTRLGFNNIDLSWHELLLKQKLDMLVIHGRTRQEKSQVPAHWDKIGAIRELRDRLGARHFNGWQWRRA